VVLSTKCQRGFLFLLTCEFGLWDEDAISGIFRQTIGTAPNSQERGVYEVDFWGWGEAGPGEGAGAGKRQLPDQPGRRRATSPGLRKSAPKIDPLRPPEEQSASNPDPLTRSDDKNNLLVLPRRLSFQSEHDSRPSSAWPKPMTPMSTRSNRTVTNPKLRIPTGRTIFSYPAIPK